MVNENWEPLKVLIKRNCTLMVEGPARVELKSGSAEAFGAPIKAGDVVEVESLKVLPIYAKKRSTAEIYGGKAYLVPENTIPKEWRELPSKIGFRKRPSRKVIVLGGIDVGKTALITYIANKMRLRGLKVGVIDADVGQSDIGPPTTIGLAVVEEPTPWLSKARFVDAVFIGSTSPSGLLHRAISAVVQLLNVAFEYEKCNIVLIDTTGWIDSRGRDFKVSKISTVNPDYVIAVQKSSELEPLLKWAEKRYSVIRVPAASHVRSRSRNERRLIREAQYMKWFEGASVKEVGFEKIIPMGISLFAGERLPQAMISYLSKNLSASIVYGEKVGEKLVLIVQSGRINDGSKTMIAKLFGVEKVEVITPAYFKHLLVAFQGKDKLFDGLGIIVDADFQQLKFKILTNANLNGDLIMHFGNIKINPHTLAEEDWVRPII